MREDDMAHDVRDVTTKARSESRNKDVCIETSERAGHSPQAPLLYDRWEPHVHGGFPEGLAIGAEAESSQLRKDVLHLVEEALAANFFNRRSLQGSELLKERALFVG